MNPIELNFTVDLAKKETQVVRDLNSPLYYGDMNAHTLNITILRNGEPEDLSDVTPYGYIVFESTGDTVELADSSSKSGNVVSVTLSDEAYAVTGRAYIVVQLAKTGTRATVFAVYCWIGLGVTDSIIVPSGSRLDIDALTSKIAEFEQKISEVQNLVDDMEDAVASANDAVKYSSQTGKTDVEKARARENIGAVGTDEMSAEYLLRLLLGNDDDWSVANYDSMSYSATKTGRTITYKGNNNSNSGFQSVNLTGAPGAPHTARSGNFSVIALADTDFVPIPSILKSISNRSADYPVTLFLSGYMHYDRYNDDGHAGFSFDYVLRRYNTETETYEYTPRTTTSLGLINTPTAANGVDRISIAQLIPDGRGGDYVVNWDEWEEMAVFAMRRNRMFSGTMLLTPSLEIYGDQKPVVYSAEQNLSETEQKQAQTNIGTISEDRAYTLSAHDGAYFTKHLVASGDMVIAGKRYIVNGNHVHMEGTGGSSTYSKLNVVGTIGGSGGTYSEAAVKALFTNGYCYSDPNFPQIPDTCNSLEFVVDWEKCSERETPANWGWGIGVYTYNAESDTLTNLFHAYNSLQGGIGVSSLRRILISRSIDVLRENHNIAIVVYGRGDAQLVGNSIDLTWWLRPMMQDASSGGGYVSGEDLVLKAAPDGFYNCTTLTSLDFTPCSSGLCEVVFTSGSTPTVLTLPSTVRMPDWWTGVEAGRTYDLMVLNGTLGMVTSWAT